MTAANENGELQRKQGIENARQSITGQKLVRSQFNEGMAITSIIEQNILKRSSFTKKLELYSRSFADSERMNVLQAENTIRDLFKARFGKSMNQMREDIINRENTLPLESKEIALKHAKTIEPMIRDGKTMPFYQAYDRSGRNLAKELKISETGAKDFMKEAFHEDTGKELYDWGKDLEARYHTPVKEAERAERNHQRNNGRSEQNGSSQGISSRFRSRKRA